MNLGIDLGMGACKVYGPEGGVQLPSHVAVADSRVIGRLVGMKSATPPLKISVDGHAFYVGQNAHDWGRPVESLDYERLSGAPEMRAIVYGALMAYMSQYQRIINEPVSLWVGMPLEPLTGDAAVVRATVTAVREWLRGRHEWLVSDEVVADMPMSIDVAEVKITSQPTGALMDYLLDDSGEFIPERKSHLKSEVGVISVGFNTVELLAIQDLKPVNRFTAGTTSGVRRLLEMVNGENLYSLGELDGRLRNGALDVKTAVPIWGREVSGAIERTWGRAWRRFAAVITVGGGALLLNGELQFAGRQYMPDDPVISIARGLYKMALRNEGRK